MKKNELAVIFNTEPDGKWGNGRLRMRWIDGVVEDLRTLGCRHWRTMA